MDQTVHPIFDFDEGAEICQVPDTAMDPCAYLITLVKRLPGIVLYLFHSQADAPRLWIDAENFNFDCISGIDQFAWVFDAFGPAHFRNMDQTFNAILEFNKGAVIGNAGDAARHAAANRKSFVHTGPGIR